MDATSKTPWGQNLQTFNIGNHEPYCISNAHWIEKGHKIEKQEVSSNFTSQLSAYLDNVFNGLSTDWTKGLSGLLNHFYTLHAS
jgi:hypothetical protein